MDMKQLLQKLREAQSSIEDLSTKAIIKENASGGASSAGGFAPVESSIGMQRRVQKPKKTQVKTKVKVDEEEIKEEDLLLHPSLNRPKPGFTQKDQVRTDHEVSMAVSDLLQCGKNAEIVYNILRGVTEEQGIPGWVQEKITKATDYLNTVAEYMEGEYHQYVEHNRLYDSGYGVIAGGTTMESHNMFHDSNKPAEPWNTIDRIAGGVREEETMDEARYGRDHLDADMWYRVDDDGLMYQRSWMHGREGEARANGWSETQEQALRRAGIIRSKFEPNKWVRKNPVTQKWVQVFPYGRPEDNQEVKEAASRAQQAAIAVNMKKKGVKPKSTKESVAEGTVTEKAKSKKQQQFFGMVRAMQKGKKIKGASAELKKAAKDISKSDVKDFAKTKHKGLPIKVERVDESVEDISNRLNETWKKWSQS